MKKGSRNAGLLLILTTVLCSCNANKELEQEEAKNKVDEALVNLTSLPEEEFANEFTLEVLTYEDDSEEISVVSINREDASMYLVAGDTVVIAYDATEEDEEELSGYTFDLSLDGGETFLDEPLVGEEAYAMYQEFEKSALEFTYQSLVALELVFEYSLTTLDTLLTSVEEKEEYEEGDLYIDLYELYYENETSLHLGYTYEYGRLVAELDDEGEQVEDEEGNPLFYFDEEDESYYSDYLALHLDTYEDVLYLTSFESENLVVSLTPGSLLYAGEIFPEE